jgi:hypothetical protein
MCHYSSAISPQEISLQQEKYRGLDHAVDRFVHGTEKHFSCAPLLHHDYRPVCEFRGHSTKVPSRKNMASSFNDTEHKENQHAGWAASGLFPFNPDRVLRDTPKPVTALTVPKAYEMEVNPYPQGVVLQTPVTSEALTSLHNLIKQDAHAVDETSKHRLQRHLQKLANAAQTYFAERALQQDQIRFLSRMNNEAKRRKSTKSTIVWKAKVMSYEDIVKAREEHAAKEAATAGKGKRGRKRKSPAQEAGAPESAKAPVARMSEAQVVED